MLKPVISLLFFFVLLFTFLSVIFAAAGDLKAKESPFTPKSYLIRYWSKQINNNLPKSLFLLSKASPLNAVDASTFTKLAAQNNLSSALPSFCSSAKLFCFPDVSRSLEQDSAASNRDDNFAVYQEDKNFTSYGTGKINGASSFKNYSEDQNEAIDSFRRYSGGSTNQKDKFSTYAAKGNVVEQDFHTYGSSATGGSGDFKNYIPDSNAMNLLFTKYSDDSHGRTQSFSSYNNNTNIGREWFTSYGKKGNGASNEFKDYTNNTNIIDSTFKGYGESANGANDTFTNYGENGFQPRNNFKSYGEGGVTGVESFKIYSWLSGGFDTFKTYAKDMTSGKVNFANYEYESELSDFTGYGQGAKGSNIGFKRYSPFRTFKDYAKNGVTFATYANKTSDMKLSGGLLVNKGVEPGKFFRESMLKEGIVMPMPDIRDKMPVRSFLPRAIVSKLPFSSSKMNAIKEIFHVSDDSAMEHIMKDALNDCERAPSPGETKRCVGSAEDMIDFATSVLGHDVALRTTENIKGAKQNIMIGRVKGINGGKVTKSVSCHQSLFPYLLYYCHSVPKARVYEADILDPETKKKINYGVAICHLDTSAWSSGHGAFIALGSGPGRIEVCHWIFENDLTWTIAGH